MQRYGRMLRFSKRTICGQAHLQARLIGCHSEQRYQQALLLHPAFANFLNLLVPRTIFSRHSDAIFALSLPLSASLCLSLSVFT